MKGPAFRFPGSDAGEQATSICCIGAPKGYETLRTELEPSEMLIAFERGSLPFGPWPTQRFSLDELWRMDAAWRHGLPGRGVAFGCVKADSLVLPEGWHMREVPFHP